MQFRRQLKPLSNAAAAISVALLTACTAPLDTTHDLALKGEIQQLIIRQQQQAGHLELIRSHIRQLEEVVNVESSATSPLPLSPSRTLPGDQGPDIAPQQSSPSDQRSAEHSASSEPPERPDSIAYRMAFSALTSLHYAEAESLFEHFLRSYRHHPQSSNARYWLANVQVALGKNDLAAANLRQVITDPAAGSKKSTAMLLLIQLYRRQGFDEQADELLTRLQNI